ncbi:unnamed protein product [Allacma fusca]|uniref:ATPase AAA-type core domain-containing protein n=1 Tax=Allacma fusca TaxID=39272 RepID=A0A8J2LFW3_9HEXA|nr:unnamed protein product [Allacma fusca]
MLFGRGKSLLAQATSAKINAPFYNVQLSQLQRKYRGESENRVRILFQTLHQHNVAVLFLDEFDAITGTRDGKDQMVAFKNGMLVEMSGVNCNSSSHFIVVLAATNISETVDPAFLSWFRYKLFVLLPTSEERLVIVRSTCSRFDVTLTDDAVVYIDHNTAG